MKNLTKETIIEAVQEALKPLETRLDGIEETQRDTRDALERLCHFHGLDDSGQDPLAPGKWKTKAERKAQRNPAHVFAEEASQPQ